MLSILIPCYNFSVISLVKDICKQANSINIKYEIICIEDGSNKKFSNQNLNEIQNVTYIENKKNIGRSKMRNLLSKKAKFKWLLFIDCDSEINNNNFLINYITRMNIPNTIFYGRTEYLEKHKKNNNTLHWFYGKKIESQRKENQFSSHHFLIEKKIFNQITFDENIQGYGHEDTLFSIELKSKKYKIVYINNPLTHIGIDNNTEFIRKTKESINNLIQIQKKHNLKNVRIIRTHKILSYLLLDDIIIFLFNLWKSEILKNLFSTKPRLFFLQFYKLGYYCEALKRLKNLK